jgi:hypothetical protein
VRARGGADAFTLGPRGLEQWRGRSRPGRQGGGGVGRAPTLPGPLASSDGRGGRGRLRGGARGEAGAHTPRPLSLERWRGRTWPVTRGSPWRGGRRHPRAPQPRSMAGADVTGPPGGGRGGAGAHTPRPLSLDPWRGRTWPGHEGEPVAGRAPSPPGPSASSDGGGGRGRATRVSPWRGGRLQPRTPRPRAMAGADVAGPPGGGRGGAGAVGIWSADGSVRRLIY